MMTGEQFCFESIESTVDNMNMVKLIRTNMGIGIDHFLWAEEAAFCAFLSAFLFAFVFAFLSACLPAFACISSIAH
jgi:hypothetical protein